MDGSRRRRGWDSLGGLDRRRPKRRNRETPQAPAEALDENANLLEVIVARLARQGAKCATNDPKAADLFLAPVLPRSKHWSAWADACDGVKKMTRARWVDALPHLTRKNAERHFFVFPRVAYDATERKSSLLVPFPSREDDARSRDGANTSGDGARIGSTPAGTRRAARAGGSRPSRTSSSRGSDE